MVLAVFEMGCGDPVYGEIIKFWDGRTDFGSTKEVDAVSSHKSSRQLSVLCAVNTYLFSSLLQRGM